MRKTYETEQNIAAQERVITDVCLSWACTAKPAPKFYEHDYFLARGDDVMAVVEVKCRTNRSDAYDTYMLSAHKWLKGMTWETSLGIPFLLVVEFTDGIFYCRPSTSQKFVRFGGRKDRGDPQDMEAVVHIPMVAFRPLAKRGMVPCT